MTNKRSTTLVGRLEHAALVALTPLLEKNVIKTLAVDVPLVFSMSRLLLLAFAAAMLRQIWKAGIAGWPEATLSMAIVLALPILGALDKVAPEDVLTLAKALIARFGDGGVRTIGSVVPTSREPSKFDDHRDDSPPLSGSPSTEPSRENTAPDITTA